MAIVIQLPAELKTLEEAMMRLAKATEAACREVQDRDYAEVERQLAAHAAEVEAAAHHGVLASLAVEDEEIFIDGVPHVRIQQSETRYRTLAGPTPPIVRHLYRERGVRNPAAVDPIALRVGAVAGTWLPETAAAMAHAVQQSTSREAATQAAKQHRLPYSRSAFEDIAHAVGELGVARRRVVEAQLATQFEVPEKSRSVSVSLDRVCMAMEEPQKRPVGRPPKGAPKRPVKRVWRMAYCGTVTFHDKRGRALYTRRFGRMPDGSPEEMLDAMVHLVHSALAQRPDLKIVALADGAPELWGLMERAMSPEALGGHEVDMWLIDFWHVAEKLAAAAQVLAPDQAGRTKMLRRWKMMLLNEYNAAARILDTLSASGKEWARIGDDHPVHNAITYLTNHRTRMRYRVARQSGLAIGSGAVEATCKSLVAVRMKRPGARWKHDTGKHILQLRAHALSDVWDDAIALTLGPLRREVVAA